MRKFFIAVLLLSCLAGTTQQAPPSSLHKIPVDSLQQYLALKTVVPPLSTAEFSHLTPNGNAVYSLPQDKMPCVVPGQLDNTIPNAYARPVNPGGPGTIPNPGLLMKPLVPKTTNVLKKKMIPVYQYNRPITLEKLKP